MVLPKSDFLLTSFFSRSPTEMQVQLKCSASARATSLRLDPGGPVMKMRFAIEKCRYIISDFIIIRKCVCVLTIGFLESLHHEGVGILWFVHNELAE